MTTKKTTETTKTTVKTKAEMLEFLKKFAESKFGKQSNYLPTVLNMLEVGDKAKKDAVKTIYDRAYALADAERNKRKGNETALKKPGKKTTSAPAGEKAEPKAAAKTKEKPKASKLVMSKSPSKYSDEMAEMFPDIISVKDLGDLRRATDIRNFEDLKARILGGETVFLATVWTERQIKQFDYNSMYRVKGVKSFPNDIDVLQVMVVCESIDRVWCMSNYTEGMTFFEAEDFPYLKDKNSKGEEFEIRVCKGMEFEVYVPVDSEE